MSRKVIQQFDRAAIAADVRKLGRELEIDAGHPHANTLKTAEKLRNMLGLIRAEAMRVEIPCTAERARTLRDPLDVDPVLRAIWRACGRVTYLSEPAVLRHNDQRLAKLQGRALEALPTAEYLRKLADAMAPPADGAGESERADTKTDSEKKLPPHDVNNCARYIVEQRKLISQGRRPKASKKALIAEHLGHDDTATMERQLRRDRYGWLLDIGGQADK